MNEKKETLSFNKEIIEDAKTVNIHYNKNYIDPQELAEFIEYKVAKETIEIRKMLTTLLSLVEYDIDSVAERLNKSKRQVLRYIADSDLKTQINKHGKKIVTEREIIRFLKQD